MHKGDPVPRVSLALFASLYALQGVVIAYFFNFAQSYMAAAGLDSATIGRIQSIALMPLILRFLGGPLSDRVNLFGLGHRRPYIVLGLALQGLGFLGLSLVNPARHVWAFTAVETITVLGLALYDTANDGMILDTLSAVVRSRLQSFFVAARFVGAMLASIAFGVWLDKRGNGPGGGDGPLWTCAGLGLIPLVLAIMAPERRRDDESDVFQWQALRVLIQPRSLLLLIFGTFYATVAYAVELNLSLYYHSMRFGDGAVGLFGASRYIGRAAGALLLGLLATRLSRRAILCIGVLGLAAAVAAQPLAMSPSTGQAANALVIVLALAFGLANGWDDALFYILAMEASDPRMAASTCALFMSVSNLSVLGGGMFAGLVSHFGGRYSPAFAAFAIAMLLALVLVPGLSPSRSRNDRGAVDEI
jgi:MFS transporter, PAT family, beta-lactamase induction signal transducer AmpG